MEPWGKILKDTNEGKQVSFHSYHKLQVLQLKGRMGRNQKLWTDPQVLQPPRNYCLDIFSIPPRVV